MMDTNARVLGYDKKLGSVKRCRFFFFRCRWCTCFVERWPLPDMVTELDHAHHFAREAYVKELQKSVEQFSKDKARKKMNA